MTGTVELEDASALDLPDDPHSGGSKNKTEEIIQLQATIHPMTKKVGKYVPQANAMSQYDKYWRGSGLTLEWHRQLQMYST